MVRLYGQLVTVHCGHPSVYHGTGVVDQHIDPRVRAGQRLGQLSYVVEHGEVRPISGWLRLWPGQLPHRGHRQGQPRLVPADQCDPGATPGEPHGCCQPNARTGTGDHHRLASEIQHSRIIVSHGARLPYLRRAARCRKPGLRPAEVPQSSHRRSRSQ